MAEALTVAAHSSDCAVFATHHGLQARGVGCLTAVSREPALFEFHHVAQYLIDEKDIAVFRLPVQLDGKPGIELIGCLVRHADASGRPGFAGSAVAVAGNRLEKISTALPVSRRLLEQLLDSDLAAALAANAQHLPEATAAPVVTWTHDPDAPVLHLGTRWEDCEQEQLASLLAHCCQHPTLTQRTVLIVDRARTGSAAIDWRFYEATRQALSARVLRAADAELTINRLEAVLAQKTVETRRLHASLDAAHAESRRLQQTLSREQLNARRVQRTGSTPGPVVAGPRTATPHAATHRSGSRRWLRNRHGKLRWLRLAMIGLTGVTLIIAAFVVASLLGGGQTQRPPSTSSATPVMKLASSDARNTVARPMSRGCANLPSGMLAMKRSRISGESEPMNVGNSGVSPATGHSALRRIPSGAYSTAIDRVMLTTAAFDAL